MSADGDFFRMCQLEAAQLVADCLNDHMSPGDLCERFENAAVRVEQANKARLDWLFGD